MKVPSISGIKLPVVLLFLSLVLLIVNLIDAKFDKLDKGFWARVISNSLIICAMIATIIARRQSNTK